MLISPGNYGKPRHFFIRCAMAGLLAIATNGSPLAETSQRRADIPLPEFQIDDFTIAITSMCGY